MRIQQSSSPISWHVLCRTVSQASEKEAWDLLKLEKAGPRRLRFLLRIHSRINKLRADREREELEKEVMNG